jgi:hypothetical protein
MTAEATHGRFYPLFRGQRRRPRRPEGGKQARRAKRYASGCFAVLAVVFAVGVSAAAAADWYVDGALGNDGNSCTAPGVGNACMTIQAAINKASSGDTINVAAGTYPELAPGPLTVNKTLTLLGAQSGVDARGRVAAESIITDSQGTWVTANNVVINGFTIQDSTNGGFTGFGILMGAGTTGTQVLNNIIQGNIAGIGLSNSGGAQGLIQRNQIQSNNQAGGASGTGIYTDQFVSGGAVKNVLVEENAFIGNNNAGIDMSNTDAANGVSNLEVSTNSFDMNGRGLVLFNTHVSKIHDNSITNSTLAGSAAIRIFDNNSDLSILDNDLIIGAGHAIRSSVIIGLGPSSKVVIHENNIEDFALTGLTVDPGSHTGTVDAECNWWNSSTGPANPNNPGGTGEEVVGDADFTPWLIAPAPGGACVGGVPSTPGKVTGGGQIGDPIFSSLGDLLSVPALIPSLADPKAQATFGFVVTCCAPTGNLEYNDHPMDVRIKAQSMTGLLISSPGISCPTTPGSKHAKFSGIAAVIRSTGTTTEPFTVDVDDCGEPGTMDTFGIKTTTYSNGPSLLIGGNIQIHK